MTRFRHTHFSKLMRLRETGMPGSPRIWTSLATPSAATQRRRALGLSSATNSRDNAGFWTSSGPRVKRSKAKFCTDSSNSFKHNVRVILRMWRKWRTKEMEISEYSLQNVSFWPDTSCAADVTLLTLLLFISLSDAVLDLRDSKNVYLDRVAHGGCNLNENGVLSNPLQLLHALTELLQDLNSGRKEATQRPSRTWTVTSPNVYGSKSSVINF